MRRLNEWDHAQTIEYNLRDGGTAYTIFADAQAERIEISRRMMGTLVAGRDGLVICEPGISAGDICGPFAAGNEVWGCDVVPAAVAAARARYPLITVEQGEAEDFEPRDCDILILCEFLEHITDPVAFVRAWLPKAAAVLISHPVIGDAPDPEPGHIWAYTVEDFQAWFPMGGHKMEAWGVKQVAYPTAFGIGKRL